MGDRPDRRVLAIIACFAVGAGTRMAPLWWSPLPATLDGIVYAKLANAVLAAGHIELVGFRVDALASTALLSTGSLVTGAAPLGLAQPLYALMGSAGVLLGAVFARRLGASLGWPRRRRGRAAVLAAFALAVDGVFVRRTGVPDDDAITLVAIPLVALAAHLYAREERPAWLVVAGVILLVLPVTHTFSTLVAALVLIGLLAGHLIGRPLTRGRLVVAGLSLAFCGYFVAYYTLAASTSLTVPYVDRVQSSPGLFAAWLVVLIAVVPWYQRTTRRMRRIVAIVPLAFVIAAIAVNARTVVFPGTAATPRVVLLFVVPFVVPAVLAAAAGHRFGRTGPVEAPLLALFLAPVVVICFSFTAGLTPEYFATALRAQTHVHLPVLVLAAAVASRLDARDLLGGIVGDDSEAVGDAFGSLRPVVAAALVVAMAATLPVAYVNLDTGSYPSTTTESEFAAGTFAADRVQGTWTSSHTGVRVPGNYYGDVNATVGPTASWLRGGPSPACAVVSQRSWTTTGAHLFPAAPATIPPAGYDRWLAQRSLVYDAGGYDPVVVTVPSPIGGSGVDRIGGAC
ncbi:sodium/phosphate symporter [Halobaculum rarum]|uniref:sodium/phosphate symporter n=1 Tax=Halobaculum rarum TaxID=3075122 RepID=UPI0032AF932C